MDERRSRRNRTVPDYRQLAAGPNISETETRCARDTWSTKTLFPLEILDFKVEDGISTQVLVHYTGWPRKYDEWRQATDVIDIPEEFVSTCPAATKFSTHSYLYP